MMESHLSSILLEAGVIVPCNDSCPHADLPSEKIQMKVPLQSGEPPHIGAEHPREPPPSTTVCENVMLTYCVNLSRTLSSIRQQMAAALPPPASKPLHSLQPGDFVVVKDFRRKHWQAKCWHGPFQILLTTHTAVKLAERATWIHASHCKRVPAPAESQTTDHDTNTPLTSVDS
ncbi:hypothetical protein L3Q82_019109 [Scortum barcoo]|uniref:Uncharacterized protein n=1 Tax=Scortum barcoo TaxID=214431 RepID=A0ACB8VG08_9TELE|nr:hypothetical protein L3Q82_019109 [Scortum barcoo]